MFQTINDIPNRISTLILCTPIHTWSPNRAHSAPAPPNLARDAVLIEALDPIAGALGNDHLGLGRGLAAGPGPESYHPRDLGPQGCRGGNAENVRTTFAPPLRRIEI